MTNPNAKIVVALDHHFVRENGVVFSELAFDYNYWKQYLEIFDEVEVFARVSHANKEQHSREPALRVASGPNVQFRDVPEYRGPVALLRALPRAYKIAQAVSRQDCSYILRGGSVGMLLWIPLVVRRRTYAREVQGEIGTSIRTVHSNSRMVRGAYKALSFAAEAVSRKQVSGAVAVSYVSESTRRKYSSRDAIREYVFSSVEIGAENTSSPKGATDFMTSPLRFISVGRLEREKGHHILLQALSELRSLRPALKWTLDLVGPGSQGQQLSLAAQDLGLSDSVHFLGRIDSREILNRLLDRSHLFILPSLTEGMPRALIEAMARGVPAVGTSVGGVPELLPAERLAEPGNSRSLAHTVGNAVAEPELLAEASTSGWRLVSDRYSADRLRAEKLAFWRAVRGW